MLLLRHLPYSLFYILLVKCLIFPVLLYHCLLLFYALLDILQSLLKQKLKSIKAETDYERNAKLIRFAAGRGFTMQEIMRFVKADFD